MTSKIEWTETTWNPVTGCTKVSEGCRNCYAEPMAKRLKAMGKQKYSQGFDVVCHEHELAAPLHWRKPRLVFVNSMGDLFHEDVPDEFIHRIFEVMNQASQHTFQVLTKRNSRLSQLAPSLTWAENIWMGVTVENSAYVHRIDNLRDTPAHVKFLSLEPLLGPIPDIDLSGINWVITGGESGPRSRPIEKEWVIDIRDQCIKANVPFFFKQWGGKNKKKAGKLLEGREWLEMPRLAA